MMSSSSGGKVICLSCPRGPRGGLINRTLVSRNAYLHYLTLCMLLARYIGCINPMVMIYYSILWPVFTWYTGKCSLNGDQPDRGPYSGDQSVRGIHYDITIGLQGMFIVTSQWVMMLLRTSIVMSQWVMALLCVRSIASQCILTLLWSSHVLLCLFMLIYYA